MPFRRPTVVLCVLAMLGCTERTPGLPDVGPIVLDGQVLGDGGTDGGRDSGPRVDGGPDLSSVLIFAHSRDTLFSFSPFTNTVDSIGVFTLPGGAPAPFMNDLAVNADNAIYTVATDRDATPDAEVLYLVDPVTAVATRVGELTVEDGDTVFALTFLAPGELGAGETLVGATNEGVVYRIDPATAAATRVGQYPDGWRSSGDLVSVRGLGTFATIRRDGGTSDSLALVRFEPSGIAFAVRGETGSTQLFGLGYWGSKLYGFSGTGQLVEIDRDFGTGTVIATPAMTGTDRFWGAGVTTRVPVIF